MLLHMLVSLTRMLTARSTHIHAQALSYSIRRQYSAMLCENWERDIAKGNVKVATVDDGHSLGVNSRKGVPTQCVEGQ